MSFYVKSDFYELCRVCMSAVGKKYHLFNDPICVEKRILAKLKVCLLMQVKENDILPKKVCENCVTKIERFYSYIKQCQIESKLQNDHSILSTLSEQLTNQREKITNFNGKDYCQVEILSLNCDPTLTSEQEVLHIIFHELERYYRISYSNSGAFEEEQEPDKVIISCTACGLILENNKQITMHSQQCKL